MSDTADYYAGLIARNAVSIDYGQLAELIDDAADDAGVEIDMARQGEAHEEIVDLIEESAEDWSREVLAEAIEEADPLEEADPDE